MNAVFCEGVLVGADAGGSSVSCAGSRMLSCWSYCCFFTIVCFFVKDSMVVGNVAVNNSCWYVVESENMRDMIHELGVGSR